MSYDAFATTFSNSRKNLHWPELEYIIADMIAHGSTSVLDIGCGNGRFIEQSLGSGLFMKHYFWIDSSSWMIWEAEKLYPTDEFYNFDVCSMQSFVYVKWMQKYNSILLLASFHHLESQEERIQVLENTKKLLKPNGRIYMTNWNLRDQAKYETSHRWDGDYDIKIGAYSRYYHGFTVDELAGLFEDTGYRVIENRIFDGGRNIVSIITI